MLRTLNLVELCLWIGLFNNVALESRTGLLVHTKVGPIRGLQAEDGNYVKFLGIPYARVNKTNPFGTSIPYPKFENIFEANNDSAQRPQLSRNIGDNDNTVDGSKVVNTLDCLQLNIFAPTSASFHNPLPVLIFTHGGGYYGGSGSTTNIDPRYLLKHDIVFVSLNYRLGPYGFMCLGTPEVPGNQGLKDQLAAFRWVKDNIKEFGGDPDKITISGHSAGSMSSDFHLYSAPEKVFNQIILQSGTSLIPEAPLSPNPGTAIKLAKLLGYNTTIENQAISFLASADPMTVVNAAEKMDRVLPCVEFEFENVEAFLTDFPINLNIPKAKDMRIMIGYSSLEMHGTDVKDALKWDFDFNEKDLEDMTNIVKHFYIGDEQYEVLKMAEFDSDINFNYPADRSITKYVENGAAAVYYYVFSYISGNNTRAGHGAELEFLYHSANSNNRTAEQILVSDRMCTMWTNFVKYGNPTPETSELLPVKWQPVTKDSSKNFMNISADLEAGKRPFHGRMSFWDLFYYRNEKYQRGYRNPEFLNWY